VAANIKNHAITIMKTNTEKIRARLPEKRIDSELKRLYTECMTYFEMFDPEKHDRYKIRFATIDKEIDEYEYFGIMNMDVSGVNLWIKEVEIEYLRQQGPQCCFAAKLVSVQGQLLYFENKNGKIYADHLNDIVSMHEVV
jgi:hypothetical protein